MERLRGSPCKTRVHGCYILSPDFKREFNDQILSSYLCFNSVPTEETFFKGVKRIEPGYQLIYKDNKVKLEKFFSLKFTEELTDTEEAAKLIAEAMEDSIKRNFDVDVPMGSLLSS
jgi:asparagine synthase (glutamine-hydrolysing)